MRPDRIVVGECRGAEALDMLQAMNTGHDGSLTTIHANSARDALSRVETMVLMAGFDLPVRAIREQVAGAVDLIVQVARLRDGSRRVTGISEVVGMEGDVVTMQELVRYKQRGVDENGTVDRRVRAVRRAAELSGALRRARRPVRSGHVPARVHPAPGGDMAAVAPWAILLGAVAAVALLFASFSEAIFARIAGLAPQVRRRPRGRRHADRAQTVRLHADRRRRGDVGRGWSTLLRPAPSSRSLLAAACAG